MAFLVSCSLNAAIFRCFLLLDSEALASRLSASLWIFCSRPFHAEGFLRSSLIENCLGSNKKGNRPSANESWEVWVGIVNWREQAIFHQRRCSIRSSVSTTRTSTMACVDVPLARLFSGDPLQPCHSAGDRVIPSDGDQTQLLSAGRRQRTLRCLL